MAAPRPHPPAGGLPAEPGPPPARSSAWIREYLDAVYRYARKRLPAADAEDVAQQAFYALFRREAEGRPPDDAGAFLLGVARRRVADRHRQQHRRPVPLPETWEGFCDELLPDEALLQDELRDLVHVTLGLLPEEARSLLRQRYRGGVSVAELAKRLGVTEKAVEMRLSRARAAFAERYRSIGRDWLDRGAGEPDA